MFDYCCKQNLFAFAYKHNKVNQDFYRLDTPAFWEKVRFIIHLYDRQWVCFFDEQMSQK